MASRPSRSTVLWRFSVWSIPGVAIFVVGLVRVIVAGAAGVILMAVGLVMVSFACVRLQRDLRNKTALDPEEDRRRQRLRIIWMCIAFALVASAGIGYAVDPVSGTQKTLIRVIIAWLCMAVVSGIAGGTILAVISARKRRHGHGDG